MHFGSHVDGAVRVLPNGVKLRTDVSVTLFLSAPDEYDGGELVIEDTYGVQQVKLPAGDMIVYPATQPASGDAGHARCAPIQLLLGAKPRAQRHAAAPCCSIWTRRFNG